MVRTVEQQTYRKLRRELLAGAWQPGRQLSALAIAKQIGVSPTPVMQAMRRLESEGFVELVPHMGAFVREPTRRQVAELFDLRRALEAFAARKVARCATERQLATMQRLIDRWDRTIQERAERNERDEELIAEAVESDLLFHMTLMKYAGSRRAIRVFHDCHLLTRVFGAQPMIADAVPLSEERSDLADHRLILHALQERKPAAAARAVDRHLLAGKRRLLASMKRPRSSKTGEPMPWSRGVWSALVRVENKYLRKAR